MGRTMRTRQKAAISVSIDAPVDVVWAVFIDVERWPTWTRSVSSVHVIDGPMGIGATARIRQPRLPTVTWTVTQFDPGRSWTWEAKSPGAHTVATHHLTAEGSSTVATQSIVQSGPVGRLVGRIYRSLTKRYLAMEAAGLKQRCEQVATDSSTDATV